PPTPPLKPLEQEPPAPAPTETAPPPAPPVVEQKETEPDVVPLPAPSMTMARDQAVVLHEWAEEAFGRGQISDGDRILRQIIEFFPEHRVARQSRDELAVRAAKQGDIDEARRLLDAVLSRPAGDVAEPAGWLRCRIDVLDRPEVADDCLWGFRLRFPSSSHDAEALALRAQ